MTDERKNEIWAMLDAEEQEWVKKQNNYITENIPFDNGYNCALQDIFGAHNLTAQAEEKPKEIYPNLSQNTANCDKSTETSQENPLDIAESVETSTKEDACFKGFRMTSNGEVFIGHDMYQQYRLDLAKEIAVAMIGNNDGYGSIACESVAVANEIVKRLKETEI